MAAVQAWQAYLSRIPPHRRGDEGRRSSLSQKPVCFSGGGLGEASGSDPPEFSGPHKHKNAKKALGLSLAPTKIQRSCVLWCSLSGAG